MSEPPNRPPPTLPPTESRGRAVAPLASTGGAAAAGAKPNDGEDTPSSGFVARKKVGMAELLAKDAEDESLRKYKESLLGEAAKGMPAADPNDPRRVVITELRVVFDNRPGGDIVYSLNNKADVDALKSKPFILKEKCLYKLQISFRVQHEIVSGLKFTNKVYKAGIRVAKEEEMLGSYAPQAAPYTISVPRRTWEEAPSGWLARGMFKAESSFTDDDNVSHLEYAYSFELKTDWK